MENMFITKIRVNKIRHIENLDIDLSWSKKMNLIITGKNGSGKTSLLETIRDIIKNIAEKTYLYSSLPIDMNDNVDLEESIVRYDLTMYSAAIYFNQIEHAYDITNKYLFVFIPAFNKFRPEIPNSIEKIEFENKFDINTSASPKLLKYMLTLDYQRLTAFSTGDEHTGNIINNWFDSLQRALKNIYQCPELELRVDAKNFNFKIHIPGLAPFGLNEMSDGYASFLDIVMELMLRMDDGNAIVNYTQPGFVFIDEIEAHLHVDLQKKIMPFLTELFPEIQFIVTTHSPFVITSLENAVVFDLEKRERLENPTLYSYESVVEAFLATDMYSGRIKGLFQRYKELLFKEPRTKDENIEFLRAKSELELVPPASRELYEEFRMLEAQRKVLKNGQN